jgi:hypothetical protein
MPHCPRGERHSGVDGCHVRFVVARACSRRQVVQPVDLIGSELDAVGGGVFLHPRHPFRAGDRGDVVAPDEQPRQADLRRCGTSLCRNGLDLVDDAEVALEVLAGESRVVLAPVVIHKVVDGADLAGEETVAQRRVRDEADSEFAQ